MKAIITLLLLTGCQASFEQTDADASVTAYECSSTAREARECSPGTWACYDLGQRCGVQLGCYDGRCRESCRLDAHTCDCIPSGFRVDGVEYGYCAGNEGDGGVF